MGPAAMDSDLIHLADGNSTAIVHLHGATVTDWQVNGKSLLFLSQKALLDGSKPIRGGIPLVFPQFGTGPIMAGQHGFARTRRWSIHELQSSRVVLVLSSSKDTKSAWNHDFRLLYEVRIQDEQLCTRLSVENTEATGSFAFTALLHTYFNVGDIGSVRIEGLEGCDYLDKLHGYQRFKEDRKLVQGISEEVDRNYLNVPGTVHMNCAAGSFVLQGDFKDIVVWNPWVEKAKAMADFGDDEYLKMICLEFGHVEEPVSLAAGQTWTRSQIIAWTGRCDE